MQEEAFRYELGELVSHMAANFARAYQHTPQIKKAGMEKEVESQSVCRSIVAGNTMDVTIDLKGGKADLFTRTLESCFTHLCGITHSQRYSVYSEQTGEASDRKIRFSFNANDMENFLNQVRKAALFIETQHTTLSRFYDIGITAQTEISAGKPKIGTKFFVKAENVPNQPPTFVLALDTNNPEILVPLIDKLTTFPHLSDSIAVGINERFSIHKKRYTGGYTIRSKDEIGNDLLVEIIRGIAQQKNIGTGHTKTGDGSSIGSGGFGSR